MNEFITCCIFSIFRIEEFIFIVEKSSHIELSWARPFILGIYQSNDQAHTWLLGIYETSFYCNFSGG